MKSIFPKSFASWVTVLMTLTLAVNGAQFIVAAEIGLVGKGSVWRYRNDGIGLGDAWRAPDFDDSRGGGSASSQRDQFRPQL